MTPTDDQEEAVVLRRTSQIVTNTHTPNPFYPPASVLCNICWAQPKNVASGTSCLVSFALLLFVVIYYLPPSFGEYPWHSEQTHVKRAGDPTS